MEQPLISVIIPVYNTELYLERCLDSVLNNTYRNLEVLCIDDGSIDHSLEILHRYERADQRVVVIEKENGGVSSARNAGLDRMTGEYVTFVDSDDFIHPQYFECLHYAITKSSADLVITEPTRVSSQDLPIAMEQVSVSSLDIKDATRIQVYRDVELRSYCHCKIVKSSVVGAYRFLVGFTISEDILFFASLWENNPNLRCCTFIKSLYFYYQGNPNSAVAASNEHELLKATRYCIERSTLSRENEQIYLYMAICQGIWHRYYGSVIKGDKTILKEANPLLYRAWKPMIVSPDFSLREKVAFSIKIFFYPLYQLYRRRDSDYRKLEREEKDKYHYSS